MTMSFSKPIEHTPVAAKPPVIKVVGLGGGGQNTVNRIIEAGVTGVDFIAANTDAQVLRSSLAPVKIQLGFHQTRGLGAGGNPEIGFRAAEESMRDLSAAMAGADLVFLTAGMGGGTGTGAIPVAAQVARALNAVVVAVVSTPFSFEGSRRQQNAKSGLAKLSRYTDTLITIPNDRLLQESTGNLPVEMAFRMADDILRQGIQGISELVTQPGLINVDFSHIRSLMQNGGGSLLAIGQGRGENKAVQAVEHALHHPMLDAISLDNARGIIANFTGGPDLTFTEVMDALNMLQERTGYQADIVPGVISDERFDGRVQVILVITGLAAVPVDAAQSNVHTATQTPVSAANAPISPVKTTSPAPAPAARTFDKFPIEMVTAAQNDLDLPAFLRRRTH